MFLGLLGWEHARAGHHLSLVRSLPRAQGPHCKRGGFGPVLVKACGGQASLLVGKELAHLLDAPLQTRCF